MERIYIICILGCLNNKGEFTIFNTNKVLYCIRTYTYKRNRSQTQTYPLCVDRRKTYKWNEKHFPIFIWDMAHQYIKKFRFYLKWVEKRKTRTLKSLPWWMFFDSLMYSRPKCLTEFFYQHIHHINDFFIVFFSFLNFIYIVFTLFIILNS